MLPITLRVTLIIGMVCYFAFILIFILSCMIIFPGLLFWIKDILGIESNMNGLFVLTIGFVIMILMTLTAIVSRQANRIRVLIQSNAILEKRVREMESVLKDRTKNGSGKGIDNR